MSLLKKINVDELWKQEQGWDSDRKSGRKFDDAEELAFWEKMAPHYSDKFNLYEELPALREIIDRIAQKKSRIIDIGCGSGNFAIPMARGCEEVLGIDFSPALLNQLNIKKSQENIKNIKTICSKWEDFSQPYEADYVIAVNSLYRICYMREVLQKINRYGTKGFVIARTVLRPYLYKIYQDLNISWKRNNDYMLIPLILWDIGIPAKVNFYSYNQTKKYRSWEEVEAEMLQNIGELSYLNYSDQLKDKFLSNSVSSADGFSYTFSRVVAIITYLKNSRNEQFIW